MEEIYCIKVETAKKTSNSKANADTFNAQTLRRKKLKMGVGKGCGGGKGSMKMVQKRDKMGYKSKVSCNTFEKEEHVLRNLLF